METKELFKLREIADYLRVQPDTIRRWITRGLIQAVELPQSGKRKKRKYLIPHMTLQRILNNVLITGD